MDKLTAQLNDAVPLASAFWDVVDLLKHIETDDATTLEAISLAFRSWLRFRHNKDQPSEFAFAIDPTSDAIALWRKVYEQSTEPILRARLGDLLWTYKSQPRPDVAVRVAIEAYLELAERWEGIEAMHCVARAADLARNRKDTKLIEKTNAIAERMFYETVDDTSTPGVSLGYLNILAFAPSKLRPKNLRPLVDRAKAVFKADANMSDGIVEIEAHIASGVDAQLQALQAERVEIWERQAAEEADPLRAYFFLRRALGFAESLPEQRERILKKVRSTDLTKLGLQKIQFEIPIDVWPLLESHEHLLAADSAVHVLERILELGAPTGDVEANLDHAKNAAEGSIIRVIATELSIDPDTRQARPVESHEQRLEKEMGEIETRELTINAKTSLLPVLRYLIVRHPIERADLLQWVGAKDVPAEVADVIGSAIFDWWEGGDALGIALRLINAIEALARQRLELAGGNVLDAASVTQRGGYRPLGDVLSDLHGAIDESWRRYLRCVLVAEHGLNLRNKLSHGIMHSVTNAHVAVLVLAAIYLARLSKRASDA
jgi:hypothetical protein